MKSVVSLKYNALTKKYVCKRVFEDGKTFIDDFNSFLEAMFVIWALSK